MSGKNNFDAIVVGAGPAGSAAATIMARQGLDVLLLERGPYPGSKNIGGSALPSRPTHAIWPNFWETAPLERVMVDLRYWLLSPDSGIQGSYKSMKFKEAPYNRFIMLRANFDRWTADQAVKAGATLLVSHKAEKLLFNRGKVVGVTVSTPEGGKSFFAPAIVDAEGVNAFLAREAGLIPPAKAQNMALYVKEIIELPSVKIEERFNLNPGEGAVIGLIGDNTAGFIGTGSMYTYKNSIGVNVGTPITFLKKACLNPSELLERIKRHPLVQPLLKGGHTMEYMAHFIPEGGYRAIPRLTFDGLILVGDTAGLVNGTQGVNLALLSGQFAGEAVVAASKKGDFSARGLDLYERLMENSYIMKDLKANRLTPGLYQRRPYLFELYGTMFNDIAHQISSLYLMPKRAKRKIIMRRIFAKQSARALVRDLADILWTMK